MSFASWPWMSVVLLGAWHGVNPAMGGSMLWPWGCKSDREFVFSRRFCQSPWGHALAIGSIVFVVYFLGIVIPMKWLQFGGAAILLVVAIWKLWRTQHPTWVGMQVNFWDHDELVMDHGQCSRGGPNDHSSFIGSESLFLQPLSIRRNLSGNLCS